MKKMILSVKEIDTETNEERELIPDEAKECEGMTIFGSLGHNKGFGMMLNDNIANLAERIASCEKLYPAAKMAVLLTDMYSESKESELSRFIESLIGDIGEAQ